MAFTLLCFLFSPFYFPHCKCWRFAHIWGKLVQISQMSGIESEGYPIVLRLFLFYLKENCSMLPSHGSCILIGRHTRTKAKFSRQTWSLCFPSSVRLTLLPQHFCNIVIDSHVPLEFFLLLRRVLSDCQNHAVTSTDSLSSLAWSL